MEDSILTGPEVIKGTEKNHNYHVTPSLDEEEEGDLHIFLVKHDRGDTDYMWTQFTDCFHLEAVGP